MLAVENEFASLIVDRRSRRDNARVPLRSKRDDFQCRIERISSVHLLQELAGGTGKRDEHGADVVWKERGTWSREGKDLQPMHYGSYMSVAPCKLLIVVDRMIVSRHRL